MRITAFYVARPTPALDDAVNRWPEDLRHIVLAPMVCESMEGGCSAWTPGDFVARAKLVLLLELHDSYTGNPEVDDFFRTWGVSIETFDRHWTIERYAPDVSTESFGVRLEHRHTGLIVARTGHPLVDAWAGLVDDDDENRRLWIEEARRRDAELDADPSRGRPAEDVFRDALGRPNAK